ncbi:hypothetical protein ACFQ2T_04910 [Methylophilus flavus]|uniref:Uncharacterized protein n=1 Tax=Methylophilus flavus TaxID=640084 RepID=A0ABW3P9H1_9PROT
MKQPYVIALLRRSENEKTPLVVYPHEVEVLKALHGSDAIVETEDTPPVASGEFDPHDEYARLEGLYIGNEQRPNPVFTALGDVDEFVASFKGKKTTVSTQTPKDSGDDSEKDELVEKAKGLGIKSPHLFGVDKLKEKIEEEEADKIKALVEKAESLNIEVQNEWDIATLESEIAKAQS